MNTYLYCDCFETIVGVSITSNFEAGLMQFIDFLNTFEPKIKPDDVTVTDHKEHEWTVDVVVNYTGEEGMEIRSQYFVYEKPWTDGFFVHYGLRWQ